MSSHSACGVIGHVDPKEVRDKKKPLKSVDKIWETRDMHSAFRILLLLQWGNHNFIHCHFLAKMQTNCFWLLFTWSIQSHGLTLWVKRQNEKEINNRKATKSSYSMQYITWTSARDQSWNTNLSI